MTNPAGKNEHEFYHCYRIRCHQTTWNKVLDLVIKFGLRLGSTGPQIEDNHAIPGYYFVEVFYTRDQPQAGEAIKALLRKQGNRHKR